MTDWRLTDDIFHFRLWMGENLVGATQALSLKYVKYPKTYN